ncbi:MAG: hypothetical protein ACP5HW_02975 [Candidatus Micrarchaeia archaeon]
MLKLIVVSLDMLASLPILLILVTALAGSLYMVELNMQDCTLLANSIYGYARSQAFVESSIYSNTVPLNSNCSGACRIVTIGGIAYKVVIN